MTILFTRFLFAILTISILVSVLNALPQFHLQRKLAGINERIYFREVRSREIVLYSDAISEVVDYANSMVDILKEAALPTSWDDVIAIAVSEGISGLVGGLAAREVENLVGDERIDNFLTEGLLSAIYFGARSIFKSVAQIIGLPRPVVIFIADIAGSLISESAKSAGRRSSAQRESAEIGSDNILFKRKNDTYPDAMNFIFLSNPNWNENTSLLNGYYNFSNGSGEKSLLRANNQINSTKSLLASVSIAEILVDVTKWVAYDLFVSDSDNVSQIEAAICGTAAGMLSILMLFALQLVWKNELRLKDSVGPSTRLWRAGLEGGILFWIYELTLAFCGTSFPKPIRDVMERRFEFM